MTKIELVEALSEKTGMQKKDAEKILRPWSTRFRTR